MAFNVRRLYRKPSGTFFLRILVGQPASTSDGVCRKRAEVRCSLRTKDRDRAVEMAARFNAQLRIARSMTERKALMDALQGNIRTWTIGPEGVSAEPGKDTEALLQAITTHPELLRAAAMPHNPPPAETLRQMMAEAIQSKLAELQSSRGALQGPGSESGLPGNPLRFSVAVELHVAGGNFVERTVADKRRLLTALRDHLAKSNPELGADPFVHEVQTHHVSSFLDSVAKKRQTDGTVTTDKAAPKTMLKKLSDLSAFFKWALDESQATLVDPTQGLTKRVKDLKKAAGKAKRTYAPFSSEQVQRIFSARPFLAFNRSADHFWAPLLAVHLGTRLKEVVTLSLDSIGVHKQTGITYLDVTPEHAKNTNSVRRLPVSRYLVNLGFLEYVEHLRKLGATRLFPHVDFASPTLRKDPSKYCSRRFGNYLDTLGIQDRDLVFHSFRHTVVSALQDNNVPLADAMQITGHQAQEHAVATGRMTAAQAQSVHIKTYVHSDRARLNIEYPLARLKGHLDRLSIGIDYEALRKAADIVRQNTVRCPDGFVSGWSSLGAEHEALLERMAQ